MKNKTVEFFPGDEPHEDVQGHLSSEGEYDVEGHIGVEVEADRQALPDADGDTDDVEAHVQPPRDLDIERI
jgi:hypothetical protein